MMSTRPIIAWTWPRPITAWTWPRPITAWTWPRIMSRPFLLFLLFRFNICPPAVALRNIHTDQLHHNLNIQWGSARWLTSAPFLVHATLSVAGTVTIHDMCLSYLFANGPSCQDYGQCAT